MLRSARDGNCAAGFGCRLEGFDVAQRSMRTRIARTSTDLSEPEVVYRRAMAIELSARSFAVIQEPVFKISYANQEVGRCKADLLVNEIAVIEIKAARIIAKEHEAQLLSELRASTHPVGLLLNFGAEPTFKRMVGPPR